MTDTELQDLADLWQQPDKADDVDLEALAHRARRKARFLAYGDAAWLLLIAASIVVATALQPSVVSVLAGSITMVVTLWLNWKRKQLRRLSTSFDTRDPAAFLDSTIRAVRGNLGRVTFSLVTLPPGLLLAILFRVVTKDPSHPVHAAAVWIGSWRGIVGLTVLAAIPALAFRSRRRLKEELARLEEVRQAYAEEARRDDEDGA